MNLDVFRAFAEGFLEMTAKTLTENEIKTLALSCFVLTVELATRFLADYIDGDLYFKTNSPDHNIVRTRCQIALAKDMLQKMPQMERIVLESVEKYRYIPYPLPFWLRVFCIFMGGKNRKICTNL